MISERGDDADHQHLRYIKQINAAIAGRPEGMAITTHSCRGNFQSYWAAEGSYDFVAEALFTNSTSTDSSSSTTTIAREVSNHSALCPRAR